jgi:hypothetical protein
MASVLGASPSARVTAPDAASEHAMRRDALLLATLFSSDQADAPTGTHALRAFTFGTHTLLLRADVMLAPWALGLSAPVLPLLDECDAAVRADAQRVAAALREWIPADFAEPPVFPPLGMTTLGKFRDRDNALLAWLLLALEYPMHYARGDRMTDMWKFAATLMDVCAGSSDPGKRVRNHVNEVLALGRKRTLEPVQMRALCDYVAEMTGAAGIPWARIDRRMHEQFGRPFGGSRLKDDWYNFAGSARRAPARKRAHDAGALEERDPKRARTETSSSDSEHGRIRIIINT